METPLTPTSQQRKLPLLAGLLLVRGALEPELQRQLIVQAFTCFCEPPNHTNHTLAYPGGLPGIWAAAQQGLRLQLPAAAAQTASQQQAEAGAAHDTASAADQPRKRDAGSCHAHAACPQGSPPEAAAAAAACQRSLWGPDGRGPPAASLLGKLRWATLGPPYDWTQRLYLRDVPRTPLPLALHRLAVALAGLAAELAASSGDGAPKGSPGCCAGPAGQRAAKAAACRDSDGAASLPFSPDAALVNFYYEGGGVHGGAAAGWASGACIPAASPAQHGMPR